MMSFKEQFAVNLKDRRKDARMTQTELAQRVGVTANCISGYENGKRTPCLELASMMAEVLGITLDDLIPRVHLVEIIDVNQEKLF